MTPTVVLTGYVYQDPEGMFVSHCVELDINTWAETLDEVKRLTPIMINGYFKAINKIGLLEKTLADLAARQESRRTSAVKTKWSARPKKGSRTQFNTRFSLAA